MHFAEEMTGRFRNDRQPYAAIAISDPSHMACVGNDYGYEAVFSRYVEGVAKKGDVLLAISTSGTSRNILAAVRAAKAQGVKVIGLTGRHDSPLEELADVAVVTPAGRYADRVQELSGSSIRKIIRTRSNAGLSCKKACKLLQLQFKPCRITNTHTLSGRGFSRCGSNHPGRPAEKRRSGTAGPALLV